jgi:hypothetical protein
VNAEQAMNATIAKVESDIFADRESVVRAAKEWRAAVTVEAQDIAAQRLADAVDRLPIVFDIPGTSAHFSDSEAGAAWAEEWVEDEFEPGVVAFMARPEFNEDGAA